MTRESLADRISNYCDALVAFSIVNALAFLITLAEPDIRCSISEIALIVGLVNLSFPIMISSLLVAMGRYRRRLLSDEGEDEDPLVERFLVYAQRFRHVLVWVFGLLVIIGVWAGSTDPRCLNGTP